MVIFGGQNFDPQFMLGGRLIPTKREGNKVYARTLRWGEDDPGETVHLETGDQLIIPAGDLVIDTRQIDSMSPVGVGGYAIQSQTLCGHGIGSRVMTRNTSTSSPGWR